jgi:hypothetical protein
MWLVLKAGEEDAAGDGEMAERATRLSESGGSRDMEDGGEEASDEAMRAMLGAQEYHEVHACSTCLHLHRECWRRNQRKTVCMK